MKIRMQKRLYERAKVCADDAGLSFSEWAKRAVNMFYNCSLTRVVNDSNMLLTTRDNSECYTVDADGEPSAVRMAILMAVEYCEALPAHGKKRLVIVDERED